MILPFSEEMNLRDAITKAVNESSIKDFHFVRLTRWQPILDRIANRFLQRGTQDLTSPWLWTSFRDPIDTLVPEDTINHLKNILNLDAPYWFIASDEDGKYWVAEASGKAIVRTIQEMYGFEYYIADKNLEWILCENHHNTFIRSSPPALKRGDAMPLSTIVPR